MEQTDVTIGAGAVIQLASLVLKSLLLLKHNLFEFHEATWRQEIGTAMGVHPAPSYANIYLAKRIDLKITQLAKDLRENKCSSLLLFKRFLDDIFLIFKGTTKELHAFFEHVNQIHPTLKFTMQHTSQKKMKTNVTVKHLPQFHS